MAYQMKPAIPVYKSDAQGAKVETPLTMKKLVHKYFPEGNAVATITDTLQGNYTSNQIRGLWHIANTEIGRVVSEYQDERASEMTGKSIPRGQDAWYKDDSAINTKKGLWGAVSTKKVDTKGYMNTGINVSTNLSPEQTRQINQEANSLDRVIELRASLGVLAYNLKQAEQPQQL